MKHTPISIKIKKLIRSKGFKMIYNVDIPLLIISILINQIFLIDLAKK